MMILVFCNNIAIGGDIMSDFIHVDNIKDVFKVLNESLSDTIFSLNSVYGIAFIILSIILIIWIKRIIKKSLVWWVNYVLFLQIMHVLAFSTKLGTWLPITQVIFKYDVLTMLAQLCVGTKFSEFLVWLQAFLNTVIGGTFITIFCWLETFFSQIQMIGIL